MCYLCTDVGQNVIKQQQTEISKCAWYCFKYKWPFLQNSTILYIQCTHKSGVVTHDEKRHFKMNLNLCVKRRIVFIEKHFYKENAGKRKITLEIAKKKSTRIS